MLTDGNNPVQTHDPDDVLSHTYSTLLIGTVTPDTMPFVDARGVDGIAVDCREQLCPLSSLTHDPCSTLRYRLDIAGPPQAAQRRD
jgi:hypothetical protein